jgi:hypothetical protein
LKSWQTSHLPELQHYEQQGLLDLLSAWYHGTALSFDESCNWPVLWEYIDRNGLGGILGSMVLDDLCDIPEPFKQSVSHRYFSTQMHFEQTNRCCKAVGDAAKQLDIPVIIFKGPAIVQQGYLDTGVRSF